jgi:cytochrome oxidase assembly protein ShyY1
MTVVTFANNHLQYALTWLVLAVMLACGTFVVLRHARHWSPLQAA